MTRTEPIIEAAREILLIESAALASLAERLDDSFVRAAELLLACRGRVVLTGVGKSGAIARKIAATLASTGTPALFLHPAEAAHGELGSLTAEDVVVVLSYSGESTEIVTILNALKSRAASLIALTGEPGSALGTRADVVLDISVQREACPLNLTPTASTTAAMALGDALALAVMTKRNVAQADLAVLHPSGLRGRLAP